MGWMNMARIKLTLAAKLFIAAVIIAVLVVTFRLNPQLWQMVAPEGEHKKGSNVPPTANLPDQPDVPVVAAKPPGCDKLPEVRLLHWAWNAQMGLMYAV